MSARFDYSDPVSLNELAIEKIREGDGATAALLLERAALLAPHDARIRRNLESLKSGTQAKPPVSRPAGEQEISSTAPAAFLDDGLPSFPLWRKKESP